MSTGLLRGHAPYEAAYATAREVPLEPRPVAPRPTRPRKQIH